MQIIKSDSSNVDQISIDDIQLSCSPAAVTKEGTNDIYIFYQGAGKSGDLFYSVYNTSSQQWKVTQKLIKRDVMSESPGAVYYNDTFYITLQDYGANGKVYLYTWDESSNNLSKDRAWISPTGEPLFPQIVDSPAMLSYNSEHGNAFFVFYQNKNRLGKAGNLFMAVPPPPTTQSGWSGSYVADDCMSASPTVIASPTANPSTKCPDLFLAMQNYGQIGDLRFIYLKMKYDSQYDFDMPVYVDRVIQTRCMTGSPASFIQDRALYFVYQGYNLNGNLACSYQYLTDLDKPNVGWTNRILEEKCMSCSPSIAMVNGTAYIFFQQYGENGKLDLVWMPPISAQ